MKIYNLLTTFISTIVFIMVFGISQAQSYQAKKVENRPDFQWPEGKKMGLMRANIYREREYDQKLCTCNFGKI